MLKNEMRLKSSHITHILSFILGSGFTLIFLSIDLKQKINFEKEKFDIIIAVISSPQNREKRDAMRESWSNLINSKTQFFFAIGGQEMTQNQRFQIIQEQTLHGDLLILPINDRYFNLTYKILKVFSHLISNYDFKYVLKCDDDTFINIKEIQLSIKNIQNNKLYWGYFSGNAKIQKNGKWKENDWFLCDRYLPYALGGGYILSYDLILYIVQNINILNIFKNEDVSVGTWLAPLNITRKHDFRFDTSYKSRGCLNNNIAIHKQLPNDIIKYGQRLKKGQNLCEKEYQNVQPYYYNWSVLPSQCCTVY